MASLLKEKNMNEIRLARVLSKIIELKQNTTNHELINNLDQLQQLIIKKYCELLGKGNSYEC